MKVEKFQQHSGEMLSPMGRIVSICSHSLIVSKGMPSLITLPYFALVFTAEGEGVYRDESAGEIPFGEGSTILVTPNLGHHYGVPKGEFWDQSYIIFDGAIFDCWEKSLQLGQHTAVAHGHDVQAYREDLTDLINLCESEPLSAIAKLQVLLARHLNACSQIMSHPVETDWLAKACYLLTSSNLSVKEIASRVAMSYESFRKRFAQQEGMSALTYRKKSKAHEAAIGLLSSSMTISQIAEGFGYYDESHFSRQFKQLYGRSPKEYRKQYLSEK